METFEGQVYMGAVYDTAVDAAVANLVIFATLDGDHATEEAVEQIEAGQGVCLRAMERDGWDVHTLLVSDWGHIAGLALAQLRDC